MWGTRHAYAPSGHSGSTPREMRQLHHDLLLLHQIGIRAQPPGKLRRAGPGIGDGERMAAGAQSGVGALCQNAVDVGRPLGPNRRD